MHIVMSLLDIAVLEYILYSYDSPSYSSVITHIVMSLLAIAVL